MHSKICINKKSIILICTNFQSTNINTRLSIQIIHVCLTNSLTIKWKHHIQKEILVLIISCSFTHVLVTNFSSLKSDRCTLVVTIIHINLCDSLFLESPLRRRRFYLLKYRQLYLLLLWQLEIDWFLFAKTQNISAFFFLHVESLNPRMWRRTLIYK